MICIIATASDAILHYAVAEATRILRRLTREAVSATSHPGARALTLRVEASLVAQEIAIDSQAAGAEIRGGSSTAVLHGLYTWLEKMGCVFEFSGEQLPPRRAVIEFPVLQLRHVPSVSERGIRMHLNFVQDQSHFSEEEFAAFIDGMARQRLNYLMFHMYTPLQWFPFSYRGVEHLDQNLGGARRPLPADMTGREKVLVREHWFPREFESIRDRRELMAAVHARLQRMMARAHQRGIRNCVSFEPESLPPALQSKLGEWTGQEESQLLANPELSQEWQESWSGTKLIEADIRHPLIIDISVERCLQCIDAYPDVDELQLISREGVKWTPKAGQSFEGEMDRLARAFDLGPADLDRVALACKAPGDEGPEMPLQARPYWTVVPGEDFHATVIGALRFVEHALAVLGDPRVQKALEQRGMAASIAVYSPHPESVRLMMPAIARMLPTGTRFHCLGDYGARDIAANLPAWKPLVQQKHRVGVITWLEFDGLMAVAQGWVDSLYENIRGAVDLGATSISFNHWRVRSLEHNAAAAAAFSWDASLDLAAFKTDYFTRLFGAVAVADAVQAYGLLEKATLYAKANNYNIGFCGDWVFRTATNPPGYFWPRILRSQGHYEQAADAFAALTRCAQGAGRKQARYMADLCRISAWHLQAVYHLQNAKLPLVGYQAWPLGNPHAAWPHPTQLRGLLREAEKALTLEQGYMRCYARWVRSCDEQGQLCSHEMGVIQPFQRLVNTLTQQLAHGEQLLDPEQPI